MSLRHSHRKPFIVPDARETMDDPDFWQHLANDFRQIPDYDRMFRADGRGIVGSNEPWKWELKGSDANPWIYGAFKDRVSHGARELPQSGTHDLLIVWLEALRLGGYNFRSTGQASGTIDRVCEASATFCEDRALQIESQEKQVPESISSPDSISESEPVAQSASVGQDEEIERRRKLLAEYKAAKAAGGERNGPIEEGRNQIPHAAARAQKSSARHAPPSRGEIATTWDKIEISFLSDDRVQIRNGADTKTWNYAEFGLDDGRSGKPSLAWIAMRCLAEYKGVIRDAAQTGQPWPRFEKRIQEIRKVLRNHFCIAVDPIPFVKGTGYEARFKIGCSPSFHT